MITVHEPRCNTYCRPGEHYLTNGIGFPHIHQTDLNRECGECCVPQDCRVCSENRFDAHDAVRDR